MAKRKSTPKKKRRSKSGDGDPQEPPEKATAAEPGFEASAAPEPSDRGAKSGPGDRREGGSVPPALENADDAGEVARAFARLHVWQIQAVRDVLFVAGVIALVWLGYALRAVTVPLLVALLLAYLFEPIVSRLSQHPKITRPMAVGGLLAVVGSVVVLILALITPFVVGQANKLVQEIQSGQLRAKVARLEQHVPGRLEDSFDGFIGLLPDGARQAAEVGPVAEEPAATAQDADEPAPAEDVSDPARAVLTEARAREISNEQINEQVLQIVNEVLRQNPPVAPTDEGAELRRLGRTIEIGLEMLGVVVGVGLLAFLIPFYFFFFSLWYHDVLRFGRQLIPDRNRPRVLYLVSRMDYVVSGFVRGRIVISLIMGALLAIGWFIFEVPYALPLGIITGIFCAVPYLGVLGIPMAVALLFFDKLGNPDNSEFWWLWVLLLPTAVFIVVQLIEGYVLIPMIAGKATGLDPVTIVVAVLAGGSVLGIYGMLLAIPLAACGRILFAEIFLPRIQAWTRGELSDPLPIERD